MMQVIVLAMNVGLIKKFKKRVLNILSFLKGS